MTALPLSDAIARFKNDEYQFHLIVNGSVTQDVPVEGGVVPSVRKAIAAIMAASPAGTEIARLEALITGFGTRTTLNIGSKYRRSGYDNLVMGANNRLFSAYRKSTKTMCFGADGISTNHETKITLNPKRFSRSKYARAIQDEKGRIAESVTRSGIAHLAGHQVILSNGLGSYLVYVASYGGENHIFSADPRTGQVLRLSAVGSNNSDPVNTLGVVTWTSSVGGGTLMWSYANEYKPARAITRPVIGVWGDSTVEQNYTTELASLTGLPTYNFGKSGQTSRAVATRFGAIPMRLVSVTGQIPASGSVTVTSLDGQGIIQVYDDMSRLGSDVLVGSLAGIPGTLSWDASTQLIAFTRSTAGSATALPAGTPFIWTTVDSLTAAPVDNVREFKTIFQFGRNNAKEPDAIFSHFKSCVNALAPRNKQFLVTPFMPTKTEILGNQQAAINAVYLLGLCFAEWPENTVDMKSYLMARATNSAEDQAAVAAGYLPPSMMTDEVHPNATGRSYEAQNYYGIFNKKGWLV